MPDSKSTILCLGASPVDQPALHLAVEFDTIDASVRQGEYRDDLCVAQSQNTMAAELINDLLRYSPSLVHFSGHGRNSGELIFERPDGSGEVLSSSLLTQVFAANAETVRCVVLNACWSDGQALAIADHVAAVVGMSRKVSDLGAITFSATFYLAIATGKSVSESYSLAAIQLGIVSPGDAEALTLRVRSGAGEVVLAGPLSHSSHGAGTSNTIGAGEAGSPERQDLVTALFEVHYGPLVRIASTLLDDTPGAEGLVRAAFIDLLYVQPAPASGEEPLFLRRHVMSAASTLLNQQRLVEAGSRSDETAKRARVLRALRALPEPQSEVLVLKHLGALDEQQVADILKLPPQQVAACAADGLAALTGLLEDCAG